MKPAAAPIVQPAGSPRAVAVIAEREVASTPPLAAVAGLLDQVAATVRRFMACLDAHATVCALWVAHTHALDAADFTPYLHVNSPERECGKSTLLDVLEAVAARAWKGDGATPSYLFRKVEKDTQTLLLDELDTVFRGASAKSESAEGVRQVLNSGFKRGGKVGRCVGERHELKDFATFCPKVLAGVGMLPDTVASRCISLRLERAAPAEVRALEKVRGDRIADELAPLRDSLAAWGTAHAVTLRASDPAVPDELGARVADVWRPLLAIADGAGPVWANRARAAALELHGRTTRDGEPGPLLLADLRDLFAERAGDDGAKPVAIGTTLLLAALVAREDRPWPEWYNGKPMTTTQLARLLKPYGIRPRKDRHGPATTLWGYRWADLEPAVTRYAPNTPPSHPEKHGTDGTPEQIQARGHSALPNRSGVPPVPSPTKGEGAVLAIYGDNPEAAL